MGCANTEVENEEYLALSAEVEPTLSHLQVDKTSIEFDVTAGSVPYHVRASLKGDTLQVLTAYSPNKTYRKYRTAYYHRDGDKAYFDGLSRIYRTTLAEQKTIGLAQALQHQYRALAGSIGAKDFAKVQEGFPLGIRRPDPVSAIPTWSRRTTPRAPDYYKVAVDAYPSSIDAFMSYGTGLEAAGREQQALVAFEKVKALNTDGDPDINANVRIMKSRAARHRWRARPRMLRSDCRLPQAIACCCRLR